MVSVFAARAAVIFSWEAAKTLRGAAVVFEAEYVEAPLDDEARERIKQLKEEELARLIKSLVLYAGKVRRTMFFRTGRGGELPGGYDDGTVVNEAFLRVLTGQRRWNPSRDPDLKKYLLDVIDSILYHLATGKDNELVRGACGAEGEEEDSRWEAGSKERRPEREWLARGAESADDALAVRERMEEEERVLRLLAEECSGDAVLTAVLRAVREYDAEPAEISEITGIHVKDVYNAVKRLDRKISRIRKKLSVTS